MSRTGVCSDGYSACQACGTSWDQVAWHNTQYSVHAGCFPLCEECWAERTPRERLPFYAQLLNLWRSTHPLEPGLEEQVGAAVMQGL